MIIKSNNPLVFRRLRNATWLALVSLAWLQLGLASHQFEHVADYLEDNCSVCVQLDRVDDDVVDSDSAVESHVPENARLVLGSQDQVTRSADRLFDSRAPPTL